MTSDTDKMIDGTLVGRILASLRGREQAHVVRWKRYGVWQVATGASMEARVLELSSALRSGGMKPGQTAAVLGRNCYDWVVADLAIMAAGGVSAGLDAHAPVKELVRQINLCNAQVLFACDELSPSVIKRLRGDCPALRTIVFMHGLWDASDAIDTGPGADVSTLDTWLPNASTAKPQGAINSYDAPAAVIFSAGTTGAAKGAVFTHAALLTQAERGEAMLLLQDDDECLSLLPIHYVLERVVGIYSALLAGTVINFPENAETVVANLVELQPTVILAGPRMWSRLRGMILLNVAATTRFQMSAVRKAFTRGAKRDDGPWWQNLPTTLSDKLVLGPIRERLGLTRARLCLTGGSVISPDLSEWFSALGRPLVEIYGHAETGIVSVGRAVPQESGGFELRLGDRGEICLRGGAGFSGYIGGASAPLPDAWWHSGDVGARHENGSVRILGAMAHMLGHSDESHNSPFASEMALKASPFIADAFLLRGDGGDTSAHILIESEAVIEYAQNHGIPFTHFESLCRASEVNKLIADVVSQVNRTQSAIVIKTFTLIERLPRHGDAEVTPVESLRRYMFSQKPVNEEVTHATTY